MACGGYVGKILSVDLDSGQMRDEQISDQTLRDYIGGYGLGARLLYDQIPAGADPLGPDNILGFLTGPLTGTPAVIGSRYVVVGKSPKTRGWGDANSGGYFGPELKFAGYDGVLVRGVSPEPVYLLIEHGQARLCDATELWGMKVSGRGAPVAGAARRKGAYLLRWTGRRSGVTLVLHHQRWRAGGSPIGPGGGDGRQAAQSHRGAGRAQTAAGRRGPPERVAQPVPARPSRQWLL